MMFGGGSYDWPWTRLNCRHVSWQRALSTPKAIFVSEARAAIAGDAGARVPGGLGPMAPHDGAVEHVAQYLMTAVRAAWLAASVFVEEAGDIGAHNGTDAKMAESGQDRAVEVAHGGHHR